MSVRIERVQAVLQEQLAEIDEEGKDLRQALASLDGAPKRAPQKATRSPKRRATKRAKKGQRLEEVSAILKANPNAKTSEVAKQIGISTNQVSGLRTQIKKASKGSPGKSRAKKVAKRSAAKAAKPVKKKAAEPKAAKAPKAPRGKPQKAK